MASDFELNSDPIISEGIIIQNVLSMFDNDYTPDQMTNND